MWPWNKIQCTPWAIPGSALLTKTLLISTTPDWRGTLFYPDWTLKTLNFCILCAVVRNLSFYLNTELSGENQEKVST